MINNWPDFPSAPTVILRGPLSAIIWNWVITNNDPNVARGPFLQPSEQDQPFWNTLEHSKMTLQK